MPKIHKKETDPEGPVYWDEPEICTACNGSGEGQFGTTICLMCGGSGEEKVEVE